MKHFFNKLYQYKKYGINFIAILKASILSMDYRYYSIFTRTVKQTEK